MKTDEITNDQDIIDSRDVDARIDYLEDLDEESDELKALLELRQEVSHPEWPYGLTLIRDSYFVDYAEQLAEDIGAISRDAQWPLNRIDWDAAADDLKNGLLIGRLSG